MIYYLVFDDKKGNIRTAQVNTFGKVDTVQIAADYERFRNVRVLEVREMP